MKLKLIITVFLVITVAVCLYAQGNEHRNYKPWEQKKPEWDLNVDSLFVVWGGKNYSGVQDCSAKARMTSNDTSLVVEVDVTDDKLILNDDPLNSDHIEIWFAPHYLILPIDEGDCIRSTSYLYGNTSYLYLYKGGCDLAAFKNEIKSPKIDSYETMGEEVLYDKLGQNEEWLKSEIDSFLAEARSAAFKKHYVFYGLIHFGVLPKSGKAVMYDKEAYDILCKQINVSIPDYAQFIKVESHIKENGYMVRMMIPSHALGFATRTGIENAFILVNVVDTDTPGKQETLLSTSQDQKWGDPLTFTKVGFHTDISVPLFPQFDAFGKSYHDKSVGAQLRESLSYVFMYTTEGWVPIDRECTQFNVYNQPSSYSLPNILKTRFKRGILDYHEKWLGNYTLGYLNTSGGSFMTVDDSVAYPAKNVLNTFLLPDSTLALITTEYDITGTYTKSLLSSLFLVTKNGKTLLAEYNNGESIVFTQNIKIMSSEWDRNNIDWSGNDEVNGDWTRLYTLDTQGLFMIVDLGNKQRVKIWWDENGDNVQFQKL